LKFLGTVRIDGHFKGVIQADGNLIVGEEAIIEANLHVSHAVISGEIHGNIVADNRVDIVAPAKVFGDIQAPSVVIDEGVIFEGKTRMYQAREADERELMAFGSDQDTSGPPSNLTAIYGIITDQDTGMPIKKAKVRCKGAGKKNTETNASGYYELINLKDGKWRIEIGAKGYKKGIARVEIPGEGTYEQNLELVPKK
jgi:cytoskeletal protein CcmA (bactofilin family)